MILKILAASAALSLLAAGAAQAQDYGTPPYGSGAYGYAGYGGNGCEGFTIAGAHAGVTLLGFNLGGGARLGFDGGGCGGGGYAPAAGPAYPRGDYVNGGYYNQQDAYPPQAYAAPVAYAAPPVVYAPAYTYSQPVYAAPSYVQPCGCQGYPAYQGY